MKSKNDVVLVFAGKSENIPRLPLSILALGAYIREHGFNPVLVDLRAGTFDFSKVNWDDVLCVGISAMSGSHLLSGIEFSRKVKSINKQIPIVWGGHHASFFPEQTEDNDFVDFVIRNEGELPLLGLLDALNKGTDIFKVLGITYKKSGRIVSNPDGVFENPENLPIPAYDLVDMGSYLQNGASNISYETSRGCPNRCSFCYVHSFHKHKWRAKSVSKVISDLNEIVKRYDPEEIKFVEDNMFVDKQRVLRIAQGMVDAGFKFKWNTSCRADILSGFTLGEFKLLRKSGCTYLSIGVESGSDRMLRIIKKDITKDQVRIALKGCLAVGIMPVTSLIVGLPGEKKTDIKDTLDFYDEMISFDPKNVEVNAISIYSPYPGTLMFDDACSLGYKPFTKLEDWSIWQVDDPKYTPWYSKTYRKELDLISSISRFKYFFHRLEVYPKSYKKAKLNSSVNLVLYEIFARLFAVDANLRWRYRFFLYAPEWKLFDFARSKFHRGK